LSAPGIVVKKTPFLAQLLLENTTEDLLIVEVECNLCCGFICGGPGKRRFPMFAQQQRCIEFTFVAQNTGAAELPPIKISEQTPSRPPDRPLIVEHPLLVVHH
jgi:hypothetical protein